MKWQDLTPEQKVAYRAAWHVVLNQLEDAMRVLRHYLTGIFAEFEDDVVLRRACYRLDFALYELYVAPEELDKIIEGEDKQV